MFHSVSLLSQAPLARRSCALPSVLFVVLFFLIVDENHRCNSDKNQDIRPSIEPCCDYFITTIIFSSMYSHMAYYQSHLDIIIFILYIIYSGLLIIFRSAITYRNASSWNVSFCLPCFLTGWSYKHKWNTFSCVKVTTAYLMICVLHLQLVDHVHFWS